MSRHGDYREKKSIKTPTHTLGNRKIIQFLKRILSVRWQRPTIFFITILILINTRVPEIYILSVSRSLISCVPSVPLVGSLHFSVCCLEQERDIKIDRFRKEGGEIIGCNFVNCSKYPSNPIFNRIVDVQVGMDSRNLSFTIHQLDTVCSKVRLKQRGEGVEFFQRLRQLEKQNLRGEFRDSMSKFELFAHSS